MGKSSLAGRLANIILLQVLAVATLTAQPERMRTVETSASLNCPSVKKQTEPNGCRVIYELSVPKAKNPANESLSYDFTINYLSPERNDTAEVTSGTIKINSIGDLKFYEGFDMGAFLIPSQATLSISGNGISAETPVIFNDSSVNFSIRTGIITGRPNLRFTIGQIVYTPGRLERFLDGLVIVRDYRAYAGIATELSRSAAMRFDDPWNELAALLWYTHAGSVIGRLPVWTNPELTGQDPANLAPVAKGVGIEAYRRQLAFTRNNTIGRLAGNSYTPDAVNWIGNQIDFLLSHRENSNPYSVSFISGLAAFTSPGCEETQQLISSLTAGSDDETAHIRKFLGTIAGDLNRRGSARIDSGRFSEALPFIQTGLFIAGEAGDEQLAVKSKQLLSQAHHGILDAWLTIARRALQVSHFDLAQQYINKASGYQKANREAILSDAALNQTIETYIDSSLNKANRYYTSGRYTDAIAVLDEASGLLMQLPYYTRRSQFEFTLSQACTKHYESILNQSAEWLDNNRKNEGRALLRKAVAFRLSRSEQVAQREEEKIGLRLLGLFEADSLIRLASATDTLEWHDIYHLTDRAAGLLDTLAPINTDTVQWKMGPIASAQMRRALAEFNLAVADNRYDEALALQEALFKRLKTYGAVSGSYHSMYINELAVKAKRTGCRLTTDWGQALCDAAYDAALTKNFGQAYKLVIKARTLYQQSATCNPDTTTLHQIAVRYHEVWLFGRRMERIDTLLTQGKVNEAVAWFDLCESDYRRNFMKLADMPAPRLETYLMRFPSMHLIDTVMQRMIYKSSANELITVFEGLRSKGISSQQLSRWLSELGNVMAAEYHQKAKTAKPGTYLNVFRNDTKWYKPAAERFIDNIAENWFQRKWLRISLFL